MKISLILLTYNRPEAALFTFRHNKVVSGLSKPYDEIIHVDNGSSGILSLLSHDVFAKDIANKKIFHSSNMGVSKGYNAGYLLATGSHLLITGIDRLMPPHWLKAIQEHFAAIPNTGVISIYTPPTREGDIYKESRYFGDEIEVNGKVIQPAIPFEARICSREFFLKCGFLREDFDTYGYEDNEWGFRAERVAKENGLINYVIPGLMGAHYEEDKDFKMKDGRQYSDYKKSFLEKNRLKFEEIKTQGFPYYNPYM